MSSGLPDTEMQNQIERLKAILDSASSAILEVSSRGEICYANHAAVSLFGYSQAEFLQMYTTDLVPENKREQHLKQIRHYFSQSPQSTSNNRAEFPAKGKNGQDIIVSFELNRSAFDPDNTVIVTILETSELKKVQIELDSSNARLTLAKEASHIGVWEYNIHTKQLTWDKQMFLLYHQDPKTFAVSVESWQQTLHPDDKDNTLKNLLQAVELDQKFDISFRIVTPKNEICYLKAYGHLVRGKERQFNKIIGVNYDLTDYFTTQESLKSSLKENRILAQVAKETVNAVVITDVVGKVTWVNQGFCRITGFSLEEVIGKTPGSVLQGKDTDLQVVAKMSIAIKNKQAFDVEILNYHKNTSPYWLRIECQPIYENNEIIGFMAIETDITEIKNLEFERVSAQELMSRTAKMAKIGVWQLDLETKEVTWSDMVYRIHEIPIGSKVELETAINYYAPQERPKILEAIDLAIKDGTSWDVQCAFTTDKGTPIWVRSMGFAEFTNGKATALKGAFQDITEMKRVVEKAKEASRAKSDFLANMSHEIRTPINGILGMNDLLMQTQLNEKQRHYAQLIQISSQTLKHLINDILDFSKIEAGQLNIVPSETNLHELLFNTIDVMAMRAQDKNLELVLDFPANLPEWVILDPDRVRQILNNLLSNAIKFTETGEVVLKVENVEQEFIKFTVLDTGLGIPIEAQSKLFSKFMQVDNSTTRKYGGTGLGLAISKQLCEMMGGSIQIVKSDKQGSEFCFTIKTAKSTQPLTVINHHLDASLQNSKLLVVDARTSVFNAVKNMLIDINIQIETALNAKDALVILREARQAQHAFDYVLIDLKLPGIDGIGLSKAIANDGSFKNLKVLLMTPQKWSTNSILDPLANISGYLAKPLKLNTLFAALNSTDETYPTKHKPRTEQGMINKVADSKLPNILVVEDNFINQQVIIGMLTNLNCQYQIAENGQQALDVLNNQEIPFDLILMDCQMPIMDGYETTQRIRASDGNKFDAQIPIVALTANAMKGDKIKCVKAGMNDYIAKPIVPEDLASTLLKWAHSKK